MTWKTGSPDKLEGCGSCYSNTVGWCTGAFIAGSSCSFSKAYDAGFNLFGSYSSNG